MMTIGTKQISSTDFARILYSVAVNENTHQAVLSAMPGREWKYVAARRDRLEADYAEVGESIVLPRFLNEPEFQDGRGRKKRNIQNEIADILAMQADIPAAQEEDDPSEE
jgi:hypothetical protein